MGFIEGLTSVSSFLLFSLNLWGVFTNLMLSIQFLRKKIRQNSTKKCKMG